MGNWNYSTTESNKILRGGFEKLLKSEPVDFSKTCANYNGNYLISFEGVHYYTGEAENISHRLKQHMHGKSTFYKSYLKNRADTDRVLRTEDFEIRLIVTNIGRKELEEFSIVNAQTLLNRFQLGKRSLFDEKGNELLWDSVQHQKEEFLLEAQKRFDAEAYQQWNQATVLPGAGIYQIAHKSDGVIYIGESSNILDRYKTHSTVTRFSAFRRSVATDVLSLLLKTKAELGQAVTAVTDKMMYLSEVDDEMVNKYIKECLIKTMNVPFGRYEMEKHLIKTTIPLLNKKDNMQ